MSNEKLLTAYDFGKKAFKEDKVRAPLLDQKFCDRYLNVEVGDGVEALILWLKGYDEELLKEVIK
ncbi:hypothetical protein [Priestia aryabhattai]